MSVEPTAFINALKSSIPECIKTDEDAAQVMSVVAAMIVNGLKNRDTVYLEGIGEWRTELDQGRKKVIFTPDRILIDGVNE